MHCVACKCSSQATRSRYHEGVAAEGQRVGRIEMRRMAVLEKRRNALRPDGFVQPLARLIALSILENQRRLHALTAVQRSNGVLVRAHLFQVWFRAFGYRQM